jgi:hypothetical protein
MANKRKRRRKGAGGRRKDAAPAPPAATAPKNYWPALNELNAVKCPVCRRVLTPEIRRSGVVYLCGCPEGAWENGGQPVHDIQAGAERPPVAADRAPDAAA